MDEENNSDSEIEDILETIESSEEEVDEGDEIETGEHVVKKQSGVSTIKYSNDKITSDYITTNEYASAMAIRSRQIALSGIHFADIKSTDSFELAKNEFEIGKCPLDIFRHVGGEIERCSLSNLKY
jgi:hypothetical protein